MRDGIIPKRLPQQSCTHQPGFDPANDLITVESWDEVLEPPSRSMVVRASASWIARLAATAVFVQTLRMKYATRARDSMVLVCPELVC